MKEETKNDVLNRAIVDGASAMVNQRRPVMLVAVYGKKTSHVGCTVKFGPVEELQGANLECVTDKYKEMHPECRGEDEVGVWTTVTNTIDQ